MDTIASNLRKIEDKINAACSHAGRSYNDVKLVVVTKNQPIEKVREVIDAGVKRLGENYAFEAKQQIEMLDRPDIVEWHMIGHVQSRKIPVVIKYFAYIHSIDSLALAKKINEYCMNLNQKVPVLLEVNVSGEESKFGFNVFEKTWFNYFIESCGEIIGFPYLDVRGLMTMPPLASTVRENRKYFSRCREIMDLVNHKANAQLSELSMGTSQDFHEAILEGATFIRIGEAIMGKRQYSDEDLP